MTFVSALLKKGGDNLASSIIKTSDDDLPLLKPQLPTSI